MEYKKNDRVTLTIEDMGSDGEGIGKVDGFTLFIKDAVIGDQVEAKIIKSKKHYAYARLEKVLQPSPFRVEPKCAYHRQCGGCQLQALSYSEQLHFKEQKIRNNLIRIGGFDAEYIDERMQPIVGMEEPFHYRNKAQYPIGTDRDGNVITGFYAGRTHTIIANTDCALGASENQQILETILSYMRKNKVTAYDEVTGKGLVRHVLIRKGFTSGQLMVCLVINKKMTKMSYPTAGVQKNTNEFLPNQGELLAALAKIQGMTSVSVSINAEKTNVIMGTMIHNLWGESTIEDTIHVRDMQKENYPYTGDALTFKISPLSFYQVNPIQTEKLYSLALEYAGLTGKETVWDLYCGIGTISLFLAGKAKKVCGVEIHPDVIVVDPPRKGCDDACLNTMLRMQPERIVYVSCDSATLARDLKILCDGGYEIRKVRGVDQFGMTVHVETVVLLSKGEVDSKKIRVEFSLEDMDMSEFQDGATYTQIKDYVLEHSGLKVSNLYISQIKRKCGIEVGKNYNLPKSEDSRQPQCPPEKEKAIREAMKYFGMI